MAWSDELLAGIAQLLDDANVGTFLDATTYTNQPTPIFLHDTPAKPDAAITLTTYPISADPELNDVVQGLQVRTRSSRDAYAGNTDLSDLVFSTLHGAERLTLGQIRIARIEHLSGAALGPDDNGRPERTDNYHVLTNRPSTNRPD